MRIIIASTLLIVSTLSTIHGSETTPSAADQLVIDSQEVAKQAGTVSFTPPKGWKAADPNILPSNVKIMVVGKGQYEYPPSINLGTDTHKGTLNEYLKIVKAINDADGSDFKDLGKITTEAGEASLSQVDMRSEWGVVRMMHVILIKDNTVYILTASALKDEFPKFYDDFFSSMKSFKIN